MGLLVGLYQPQAGCVSLLAVRYQPLGVVKLFGKKKGSGESIWDIKKQIGELSTEFHMKYVSLL